MAQLVEHHLAKVGVAGSNPVVRSRTSEPEVSTSGSFVSYGMATWPSGKAEACKAFTPGSNPGVASNLAPNADMAQLVEHHLAKVRVAGSNPVVRSIVIRSPVRQMYLRPLH